MLHQHENTYEDDAKEVLLRYNGKLTMNSHGMMFPMENPHFTQVMSLMNKTKPVLDLAVAYGFTTKKLLDNGFQKVIANDLEEKHLQELWQTVSEDQKKYLELMPGNVLDMEFDKESIAGIIAIKLLHFIHGNDVRKLFKKFHDWLQPGGMFFILNFCILMLIAYLFY
jgi:SAM-dependent methyltransferase